MGREPLPLEPLDEGLSRGAILPRRILGRKRRPRRRREPIGCTGQRSAALGIDGELLGERLLRLALDLLAKSADGLELESESLHQ